MLFRESRQNKQLQTQFTRRVPHPSALKGAGFALAVGAQKESAMLSSDFMDRAIFKAAPFGFKVRLFPCGHSF
jgi:hypothetical protein